MVSVTAQRRSPVQWFPFRALHDSPGVRGSGAKKKKSGCASELLAAAGGGCGTNLVPGAGCPGELPGDRERLKINLY